MHTDLPRFDEIWRRAQPYQPFFCEENVWQLLHRCVVPTPAAALFVTNEIRAVSMWGQRAATMDPIVWDYHVVALLPAHGLIVDLDHRNRAAMPVREWLQCAFRSPPPMQPRFRSVPAAEFLATFSTDRSHMRDARGRPRQPFPEWPAPYLPERGMNLPRFLDLDDDVAGTVTDAAGLLASVTTWA